MVSMATRTSEMPVRKFALRGKKILLQLTLQASTEVGCGNTLGMADVKISLVIFLLQRSACSLPGWRTEDWLMAFVPRSYKAMPCRYLQPRRFFPRKAEEAALGSKLLFWPSHPSGSGMGETWSRSELDYTTSNDPFQPKVL